VIFSGLMCPEIEFFEKSTEQPCPPVSRELRHREVADWIPQGKRM